MKEKVIRNVPRKGNERYKYFSVPFLDIYYQNQKILIKNYIIDPDLKTIR